MRRLTMAATVVFVAVTTATPANAAPPALPSQPSPQTAQAVTAADPAPEVVGTEQAVSRRLGANRTSTTIRHADATYVKVHIDELLLRPGDYITVSDPAGRETHTYLSDPTRVQRPENSAATTADRGFWAMSVEGDTAVVTLHSPTRGIGSYVRLDRIARGFTPAEFAARDAVRPLSICGANDYRDAVCYRSSHPTEYQRSRAVARLLIGGTSACTGWRVGPNNRLLTNNHCVSTTSGVRQTEIQFNYDCPTCGGTGANPVTKVVGEQMLKTSPLSSLDYTLLTVQNFGAISSFGYLELDARRPLQGEQIYIAGHPRAAVKKLSITSDRNNGNCVIDRPVSGVNSGYLCDTEGGSSGSPVIARSTHRVIALHHLGGCPNEGTRIELIKPEIDGIL
ncbi:trypsin-like serine peptidase [Nonomuraea lactucae]|uniref:trypsin-like serine peptidase n=1 Tax=Nonomuraea lactucae TaxID=2249762 RepID=UPI00196422E6|nr:serine protease [Nonomuraea lactucae]